MKNYFSNRFVNGKLAMRPAKNHPNPTYWEALRAARIEEQRAFLHLGPDDPLECLGCGYDVTAISFDLHHRHYDSFGRENPGHTGLYCRLCHDALTNRLRTERHDGAEYMPPIAETPIELERYRPASHRNTCVEETPASIPLPELVRFRRGTR